MLLHVRQRERERERERERATEREREREREQEKEKIIYIIYFLNISHVVLMCIIQNTNSKYRNFSSIYLNGLFSIFYILSLSYNIVHKTMMYE